MKRDALLRLEEWKNEQGRRPLLLKGARQVGKTWLIREFGRQFDSFVEFNFEQQPALGSLFQRDLEPGRLISELSAVAGTRIVPGQTLLFFDEVQQCLPALNSVRYFAEQMPHLHLVAAGSMLNMVLHRVPTGVGRVSYLNLYPMSFGEFLVAVGEEVSRDVLRKHPAGTPLPQILHERLLDWVHKYMLLGGMPAVLARFVEDRDFLACRKLQEDLVTSFLDDFRKYDSKVDHRHLAAVFRSVPVQLGRKFKYVSVDPGVKSTYLSKALDVLEMAGVAHKVYHCSADGVPLGAKIRSNRFKVIFFDTGLAQCLLRVDAGRWMLDPGFSTVNSGSVAEQFAGQELVALLGATPLFPLTYWHREARGSSAEVDYVIERDGVIWPVEVKEGTQGGMKSMHLFLKEKKGKRGVKVSRYGFSDDGTILTVPFYAIERLI